MVQHELLRHKGSRHIRMRFVAEGNVCEHFSYGISGGVARLGEDLLVIGRDWLSDIGHTVSAN